MMQRRDMIQHYYIARQLGYNKEEERKEDMNEEKRKEKKQKKEVKRISGFSWLPRPLK